MSADANRIVNQETIAGKASVVLRTKQPFALYSSVTLSQANPQRHSSLSANGRYISLVRDLADGRDQVLRYDLDQNVYLAVATSTAVLEYPTISEKGTKVLWLQNGTTDLAILKDIPAGTTQTVLSSASIGHPSLAGDGLFMAYSNGSNIVTKQLVSGLTQTITGGRFQIARYFGPIWASTLDAPLLLSFTPFQIAGISPTAPIELNFSEAMNQQSVQNAFRLRVNGILRTVNAQWNSTGSSVSFSPTTPFNYGDNVTWSLSKAAKDLSGNALTMATSYTFKIAQTTTVTIIASEAMTGTIHKWCFFLSGCATTVQYSRVWAGGESTLTGSHVYRAVIGFDLFSQVPATTTVITGATLTLHRNYTRGNPFDVLGNLSLQRMYYGASPSNATFNALPLTCNGIICALDFNEYPGPDWDIDVLKFVQADWIARETHLGRSQSRLRFANSARDGENYFSTDYAATLTITYEHP
jgi:Bacterial Ig-like domain